MDVLFQPGQILDDKFELLELLGSGGIGSVYRARQIEFDRLVAIKILHEHIARDDVLVARFQREAQSLVRLSHVNIVTIYHYGITASAVPYLVMELIDGKSVGKILKESGRLPTTKALSIAKDLAEALSFVHKSGIIHRDLKPDNLVLTDKPSADTVKLIDFGFACFAEETSSDQRLTASREILGTATYMSPEQCQSKTVSSQSDIYSLCVCLYEMLTGHVPFKSDSFVGLMYMHINDPLPEIKPQHVQKFHKCLNQLISTGMAKEPKDRFGSMEDFASKIAEAIELVEDNRLSSFSTAALTLLVASSLIVAAILFIPHLSMPSHSPTQTHKNEDLENGAPLVSPVQAFHILHDKLEAAKNNIDRTLLAREAYEIATNSHNNIQRNSRLRAITDYASALVTMSLPSEALSAYKQVRDDIQAKGFPISKAEYRLKQQDLEAMELKRAAIFVDFGKTAEANKILEQIYHSDPDKRDHWRQDFIDCCLILQNDALARKWLDSCNDFSYLVKAAGNCREFNNIALAQKCISRALKISKDAVYLDQQRLKLEQAYMAVATGNEKEAKSILKNGNLWSSASSDLDSRTIAGISNLLAVLGETESSNKYLLLLKQTRPEQNGTAKKTGLSYQSILENKNQANSIDRIAAIDALLNGELSLTQRCSLLVLKESLASDSWQYIPDRSLAYFMCKEAGEKVNREMRLYSKSRYAHSLSEMGMHKLEMKTYDEILQDVTKFGLPKHENPYVCKFDDSQVVSIKIAIGMALCGGNAVSEAQEIVNKLPISSLPRHAPYGELFLLAQRLNDLPKCKQLIANCPSIIVARFILMHCLKHNQIELANLCTARAKQLLAEVEPKDKAFTEFQIDISDSFVKLESGKPDSAKELLRPFLRLSELPRDVDDKTNNAEKSFKLAAKLSGLDKGLSPPSR